MSSIVTGRAETGGSEGWDQTLVEAPARRELGDEQVSGQHRRARHRRYQSTIDLVLGVEIVGYETTREQGLDVRRDVRCDIGGEPVRPERRGPRI